MAVYLLDVLVVVLLNLFLIIKNNCICYFFNQIKASFF